MKPRNTWQTNVPPFVDVAEGLDPILDDLDPSRLAIFIGAGISVDTPSNMPTASLFLNALYDMGLPSIIPRDLFTSRRDGPLGAGYGSLRFEAVIDIIQRRFDSEMEILDIFRKGQPNQNHHRLASLVKQGALLITTNFDNLLEKAAESPLPVIASSDEFETANYKNMTNAVWHLHGILQDPVTGVDRTETVAASIQDCWKSKDMFELGSAKYNALANALADRDLIVMGYSGSDDFDICPALETIHSNRKLIWIDHGYSLEYLDDLIMVDRLPDGEMWYRHPARNIIASMIGRGSRHQSKVRILRCEVSKVIERIATKSYKIPDYESSGQISLITHFRHWTNKHLESELDRYLLGILLCNLGNFQTVARQLLNEAALKLTNMPSGGVRSFFELLNMAIETTPTLIDHFEKRNNFRAILSSQPAVKAAYLLSRGRVRAEQGWLDQGIDDLREAIALREALPPSQDIVVARHELAYILFMKGYPNADLMDAKTEAVRGLSAAKADSNPEGIARCHLLLARIYEREGNINPAMYHYQQALTSAKMSGIDALVASSSGEFGLFLWIEGSIDDHLHAAAILAEAFRIHSRQNDYSGLRIIASNLALCLESLGELQRSLLSDCVAYQCALRDGDKEIQSIALDRITKGVARFPNLPKPIGKVDETYIVSLKKSLIADNVLI